MIPLETRLISLAILGLFMAFVLRLLRTHRLSLRDSLVWILSTAAAALVTAVPELLGRASQLAGFQLPSNFLFGAGHLYLAINVLVMTVTLSTTTDRVRRLGQECALLRAELEALKRGR